MISTPIAGEPDAHRRGNRDPSCRASLEHGARHCHACGAKGGAFDAATARGYSDRGTIDLMVACGITAHHPYRRLNANAGSRSRPISARAKPSSARIPDLRLTTSSCAAIWAVTTHQTGHMSGNQAHKWPVKYIARAVRKVAEE